MATSLRTIKDRTKMRRRIVRVFELAERGAHLTSAYPPRSFLIISGCPTNEIRYEK